MLSAVADPTAPLTQQVDFAAGTLNSALNLIKVRASFILDCIYEFFLLINLLKLMNMF